jgi:hypothetical protein
MRTMNRAGVAWLAALALASADEAAAQAGVLAGVVIDDSSGAVIGGAQVHLLAAAGDRVLETRVASARGEFAFPIRRRGEYRLRASSGGFREVITPKVAMEPRDSVGVEVRLREGIVLLTLMVSVPGPERRRLSPGLDNYRHRQRNGVGGRFITRDQVQARNPSRVTDMLSQAGFIVAGSMLYLPRTRCAPLFFMDGVQMTRRGQNPFDVINSVHPEDVEGIEIYSGRSTMPAEFGSPGAECGVIAVWTRRHEPLRR